MLRCGVVGLGRGRQFVSIFESLPQCKVIAVCDPNPEALMDYDRYATHIDFEAFLQNGLDIVAVVSPAPVHAEQSIAALERGCHVLCETPCIFSVEEARRVVETVKRTDRKYMLAENYIWTGWYLSLSERMNAIGEVIYAEGDYTHDCRDIMLIEKGRYIPYSERKKHPKAKKTWRATDLPPLTYSSHTLGPLLSLMNDRVVSCYGVGPQSRTTPELGTIDLEVGLLKTDKGAIIRLTNGFTVAHPMGLHYKIVGTKGSALVQRYTNFEGLWYSDEAEGQKNEWQKMASDFSQRSDGKNDIYAMVEDFVESVVRDAPLPLDVHSSIGMVLPGILAHESAQQGGRTLEVPDFR